MQGRHLSVPGPVRSQRKGVVSFIWANFTKEVMPELKVEISGLLARDQVDGGGWG